MSAPEHRSRDLLPNAPFDRVAPVSPPSASETQTGRSPFLFAASPLARKIITFNLIALAVLGAGILYPSPSQTSLTVQRAAAIVTETDLIARLIEAQLPTDLDRAIFEKQSLDLQPTIDQSVFGLDRLTVQPGAQLFVFRLDGQVLATLSGGPAPSQNTSATLLTDFVTDTWNALSSGTATRAEDTVDVTAHLTDLVAKRTPFDTQITTDGGTMFAAVAPIHLNGAPVAMVALTSAAGEIDALTRAERERVLRIFILAIGVSIVLSLVLASTIANPLADLAAAAEHGRDKTTRKRGPARVRIPDLTARADEIGRLSGALRAMVAALYSRIDGNEQFAADVAHEIKNPLASLRSAVGTLRRVKRDDQRARLLDVIEHDVRRLDRLVSDISNASRLDSELVKEEQDLFDLLHMLRTLGQFLAEDAKAQGIEFILDLPKQEIEIQGLEDRLAQVFVNLITNAISFCEDGDAIRVWARKRENRVLVVVEDTGPGIPEEALSKIFKRFYSQRPEEHFGNNSGLGLAISKQIVEAHGGVIWAENIRPTDADVTSEPLGARFVVGLPI